MFHKNTMNRTNYFQFSFFISIFIWIFIFITMYLASILYKLFKCFNSRLTTFSTSFPN